MEQNDFKIGDKVVCIDIEGMESMLSLNEQYTVVRTCDYPEALHVSNGHGELYVFPYRFTLAEDTKPSPNGVDAQGNAIYFDQTMLKPFMRVVTNNGGNYIVTVEDAQGWMLESSSGWINFCNTEASCVSLLHGYKEYMAKEVYDFPDKNEYLKQQKRGNLIWKRTPPKTAEQVAQEAAVAARNKAIEEAENALKLAQERLEVLKQSF